MRPFKFWEEVEIDTISRRLLGTHTVTECCANLFGVAPPLDMGAQLETTHRKTLQ